MIVTCWAWGDVWIQQLEMKACADFGFHRWRRDALSRELLKLTVETALGAELTSRNMSAIVQNIEMYYGRSATSTMRAMVLGG